MSRAACSLGTCTVLLAHACPTALTPSSPRASSLQACGSTTTRRRRCRCWRRARCSLPTASSTLAAPWRSVPPPLLRSLASAHCCCCGLPPPVLARTICHVMPPCRLGPLPLGLAIAAPPSRAHRQPRCSPRLHACMLPWSSLAGRAPGAGAGARGLRAGRRRRQAGALCGSWHRPRVHRRHVAAGRRWLRATQSGGRWAGRSGVMVMIAGVEGRTAACMLGSWH